MDEEFKEIGENAGKIWRYLDEVKIEVSIQDLRQRTNLGVIEIAMAIGWLARESNINIRRKGNLFYISHLGY